MRVLVTVKALGRKRSKLREEPFELARCPQTVEEFIREAVHTCVQGYNTRFAEQRARPLSEADIERMSELGKIAFGLNYGGKAADESQAVATALQAYADGLFRIFVGEVECGPLSEKLTLNEGDTLILIRLTMLTGGFF